MLGLALEPLYSFGHPYLDPMLMVLPPRRATRGQRATRLSEYP